MGSVHSRAAPSISIVIPALNEAENITTALHALQPMRAAGHEVIVVDGGSTDGTAELASRSADRVVHGPRGRGRQMNMGAGVARGDVLLFLHADTQLPPAADALIIEGLARSGRGWGRFDVRLSGRQAMLRVVERMISWRSRLTAIASGDQAIFVRREWFERAGGFPEMPLMEDIALSHLLKQYGRPLCLREPVITSSRRWESGGIWRTILLMWRLRIAYYLGADPARLASDYRQDGAGRE